MGALLGKSREEIRAIPAVEFQMWQSYYLIEPWGFENIEFLSARIMAQMFNLQQSKRSHRKKISVWIRDMPKLVLGAIYKERKQLDMDEFVAQDINLDTEEGKKLATERIIANIKSMFGKRVVDNRSKK